MDDRRVVFLFPTTHAVMHAAQLLECAGLAHQIIPRPKGVDVDCGIAISVRPEVRETALVALREGSREPSRVLEHRMPAPNAARPSPREEPDAN